MGDLVFAPALVDYDEIAKRVWGYTPRQTQAALSAHTAYSLLYKNLMWLKGFPEVEVTPTGKSIATGSSLIEDIHYFQFSEGAGNKSYIYWDLPIATRKVGLAQYVYLATRRYCRVMFVDKTTGNCYGLELYPPATTADIKLFKIVGGVRTDLYIDAIDIVAGSPYYFAFGLTPKALIVVGSRRLFAEDTEIASVDRVQLESENDDTIAYDDNAIFGHKTQSIYGILVKYEG